jgi:hypothetical protein
VRKAVPRAAQRASVPPSILFYACLKRVSIKQIAKGGVFVQMLCRVRRSVRAYRLRNILRLLEAGEH